ncbi:hypothetical protein FRB95_004940 [Tulasnella sp. JGI-2019a]|nr:hypothetical protein FRB95_004940 [Tulasnella sp. JGI-2019a]
MLSAISEHLPPLHVDWLVLTRTAKGWQFGIAAGVGTVLVLHGLGKLLRTMVLVPKFTIMDDIPNLGRERKDGKIAGRAVVCGGSIAGLFSATICSFHFESVLIIEPEQTADEHAIEVPKPMEFRTSADGTKRATSVRSRIAQYLAIHAFLPPITLGLRRLFPNLDEELDFFGVKAAPLFMRIHYGNVFSPEVYEADDPRVPQVFPITRSLFEVLLRRLVVKGRSNIIFLNGTVDGLERAADGDSRLTGVHVRTKDGERSEPATLVVDATGPAQMAYHKWLKNAGFVGLPQSKEYDPCIHYEQTVWTLPAKLHDQIDKIIPSGLRQGIVYTSIPDWTTGEKRVFVINVYERSQMVLSTASWGKNERPKTIPETRAYIQSMVGSERTPPFVFELLDVLEEHEEEISPWVYDAMIGKMNYIPYHDAKRLPSNWVAVGDAVMRLNPVYGQGCTKAMIDVTSLDNILRTVPSQRKILPKDFSKRFFNKRAPRVQGLWDGTKDTDYAFPATVVAEGDTRKTGAFGRNLGRYILITGRTNLDVQSVFFNVNCCLSPATDLFSPLILAKITWTWLKSTIC